MLRIYARHVAACVAKLKARDLSPAQRAAHRRCGCPLWIIGADPHGVYHRHSLDTTSWEVADSLKRNIELGIQPKPQILITDALEKWQTALLAAKRKERSVSANHGVMAASLAAWCAHTGLQHLHEITLDHLNQWVATWDYASSTHRGRIDRARQFFKFALAHKDWGVTENLAKALIKPPEDQEPTLPYTAEEETAIFDAALRFGARRHFDGLWSANPETARALMLVLRWTGLRAGDAVHFEPRSIRTVDVDGHPVHVYGTYQMKTREWVMCPIPPGVAAAIAAAPRLSEPHAFIPPAGAGWQTDDRSVTNGFYTNYLQRLSTLCGVPNLHAHRFRDTFAVRLLERGKPLELVQVLLGHKSIKTTEKHYSPWVRSRAEHLVREVMAIW